MSDLNSNLIAVSAWVDAGSPDRDPEALTWSRVAQVAEEAGETIAALIGATGQNPRKGVTHTWTDVRGELFDAAAAALMAVAHLHGNESDADVLEQFTAHVARTAERAGLRQ